MNIHGGDCRGRGARGRARTPRRAVGNGDWTCGEGCGIAASVFGLLKRKTGVVVGLPGVGGGRSKMFRRLWDSLVYGPGLQGPWRGVAGARKREGGAWPVTGRHTSRPRQAPKVYSEHATYHNGCSLPVLNFCERWVGGGRGRWGRQARVGLLPGDQGLRPQARLAGQRDNLRGGCIAN